MLLLVDIEMDRLLNQNYIDGTIVSQLGDRLLDTKLAIARTSEEIIAAASNILNENWMPNPELVSLTSVLAAAEYNYWTSPQKTDTLKDAITHAENRIQDHIMATFGRKNPTLLAGGNVFNLTGKITGRSP